MPTLKKRSGKTTITLYASEERQIQGAIDVFRFAEVNGDGAIKTAVDGLAMRSEALLKMLEPPPPVPKKPKGNSAPLLPDDDKPKPF